MGWQIQIPFRERSDPLSTVGELANRLGTDEECAVARQLVLSAALAGLSTAGALVDRIHALDKTDRRQLLDAARQLAGLKSASDIEFREQHKRRQLQASIKADNETRPLRLAYTETGGLVDLNERDDEIARERTREESRRRQREEREAELAILAEEVRRDEQAARDAAIAESPQRRGYMT